VYCAITSAIKPLPSVAGRALRRAPVAGVMFLNSRATLVLSLALALVGCDTCNEPGAKLKIEDLAGTYMPDKSTDALLIRLGFDRAPSIVIEPNGKFKMLDMPTIWRDWERERPLGYEEVSGDIGITTSDNLPTTFDVGAINDTEDRFFFAGSRFCGISKGVSIQFPYRGWDIGEYLVFVPVET